MYGCSKDCLILIPFRQPQISCFPLSFKCFSSDSDNCPNVGIGPLLQVPHLPRASPLLLTLLFFSLVLLSYQVLRGSIYSFPLIRYFCTSVSEGLFLMYPWREMYSTFTYYSTILILLHLTHLVSAGCRRHWTMIYHIHWYIHGLGKPSPTPLWKKKKKGCLGASSSTFNLSQHQGLFKWVSSLHQVAKLLELKHQSFQWIFRTDFL